MEVKYKITFCGQAEDRHDLRVSPLM